MGDWRRERDSNPR